jgi:N-acyl homoserine lactone hydrolase
MITGTPERLYLMQLGTTTLPTPRGPLLLSNGCYLIRMSSGGHILIDSGTPADYTPAPGTPPTENESNVLAQLAALGLTPADISAVICTHFDIDHAGYLDSFPDAAFIVQRAHMERAKSGDARLAAARAHWDHPALHYRLVDGDTELAPGLTLLETSGHVAGHQSVLVRLPESGPTLLAIDAVVLGRFFTPDRPAWPMDADAEQTRASTRKLLAVAEWEQVGLVVFHHDGEQWATLRKSPEWYG